MFVPGHWRYPSAERRLNCRLVVEFLCTFTVAFFSITGSAKAGSTPTPPPVVNGKIAFFSTRDGTGEIYLMEGNGSNPTRLTHSTGWPPTVTSPAVSPDGKKVVFAKLSFVDGNEYDLYLMDADGSNEIRLTNNPGADYQPDWSPDGTRIAFTSRRDGNLEIYVMDADGSNLANLTNTPGDDRNPAWSPDGGKIAFDSDREEPPHAQVYVMNADGSDQIALTTMTYNVDPTWSPDGARIAFSTLRWGHYEIYAMNADGSNETRLTNSTVDSLFPSWSPDGTRIAFCTLYTGDAAIFVMDPDGSNAVNLTNSPGGDVMPNWQKVPGVFFPTPTPTPTLDADADTNASGDANSGRDPDANSDSYRDSNSNTYRQSYRYANRDSDNHADPDRYGNTHARRDCYADCTTRHSKPDARGYAKRYAHANHPAGPGSQHLHTATSRDWGQRDDWWIHHYRRCSEEDCPARSSDRPSETSA